MARFSDLKNPVQRDYARKICEESGVTVENFDTVIDLIMQRFI